MEKDDYFLVIFSLNVYQILSNTDLNNDNEEITEKRSKEQNKKEIVPLFIQPTKRMSQSSGNIFHYGYILHLESQQQLPICR